MDNNAPKDKGSSERDSRADSPIGAELRALVNGLRKEVQSLRNEVTALRRSEAPDGTDALLTREEAADRLSISVRKLDELEEAGEIQSVRIDRSVRYHPETLDRFVRRRTGGDGR